MFARPHWVSLAGAVLAASLAGLVASAGPLVQKVIVDDVIVDQTRSLRVWLGLLLAVGLATMVLTMLRRNLGTRFSMEVQQDLGVAVYEHVNRLDARARQGLGPGEVFTRATADVRLINAVLGRVHVLVGHTVHLIAVFAAMLWLSTTLALLVAVFVPVYGVLAWRMRTRLFPATWHNQQSLAETTSLVAETSSGIRVVKAFGRPESEGLRYTAASRGLFRSRLRTFRLNAFYGSTLEALPGLGQVLVVLAGGLLAINGQVTLGTFVAFAGYVTQVLNPIRSLTRFFSSSQQARAGAERVFDFLDRSSEVAESSDVAQLGRMSGLVEFDQVSFGYEPEQPVLKDFSLRIEPGERVAVVGLSGAGKSTVARLLVRMYDVDRGSVRVDGWDVKELGLDDLRSQVGGVIDTPHVFSKTIRENIAFSSPGASESEVVEAAGVAGAAGFIESLPNGYDTVVGEKGLTLSGGQRQRIALARAVLADHRVLVLDEATSAVDALTEEAIHDRMRTAMEGRTTIVIANRRSTLRLVDRIVVLDGGGVVAEGDISSLLESSGVFRSIWGGEAWSQPLADEGMSPPVDVPGTIVEVLHSSRVPIADGEYLAEIDRLPPLQGEPDLGLVGGDSGARLDLGGLVGLFRRPIVAGLALVALSGVIALVGPLILRYATDDGIIAGSQSALVMAAGLLLVAGLVVWVLSWTTSLHTARTAERMLFVLRVRTFRRLLDLPIGFFERETTGRIIARLTADVEALGSLLQQGLIGTAVSSLTAVGAFVVLFVLNWRLALGVFVVLIPIWLLTVWFRARAGLAHKETRHALAAVYSELAEGVDAVATTQLAAGEERMVARYLDLSAVFTSARLRTVHVSSLYFPVVRYLGEVASAIVLGIGTVLINDGLLTVGLLLAFLVYVEYFFTPMQELSEQLDLWAAARVSLVKIEELMAEPTETAGDGGQPPPVPSEIALTGVTFTYPGSATPALADVDLVIRRGETLAVVGSTGAGKSTLAKLLMGFYTPTAGSVTVDGVSISTFDPHRFRQMIGYVQQEAVLFGMSVRENLAYGRPDASEERVEAVARSVGIHETIVRLPDGYDTLLRPDMLSSGERQLLCLARALLIEPDLLILDEATANLDLASEGHVQEAMEEAATSRTTLLIAHRLHTVMAADRVLVFEGGRIVEEGTHPELVALEGHYARMWAAFSDQADDEALAS